MGCAWPEQRRNPPATRAAPIELKYGSLSVVRRAVWGRSSIGGEVEGTVRSTTASNRRQRRDAAGRCVNVFGSTRHRIQSVAAWCSCGRYISREKKADVSVPLCIAFLAAVEVDVDAGVGLLGELFERLQFAQPQE